ncbi:SsgA family sporulation/cell division regulator [Amycolatopsis sp. NPDC001319]|uniref:SsgA family sporulation/cell division regulator n=1 Tax=unclassified Amycolatopsis TaxID=2618356 RepID=UPI00368C195F
MTARTTLRRRLTAGTVICPAGGPALDGGHRTVTVTYRVSDPFAVELDVPDGPISVVWLLSRDLLADGLNAPAGIGDIEVTPATKDDAVTWVTLHDPQSTGSCNLAFKRAELERFLDESDAMVPAGTEATRINWDRELALLAGDR